MELLLGKFIHGTSHMFTLTKQRNTGFILFVLVCMIVLASVFGSPYRHADGGSGRYLPNLYRYIDPTLFPNDPVADAFLRFQSVFYIGLGYLFRFLNISVMHVETCFYGIFIISKIGLLVLIYLLLKALKQDILGFVLLGMWVAHGKTAAVGGDSSFGPILIHGTIAMLLGIAALTFHVRGNRLAFWVTLSCAVFVHSLITLHLAMLALPVLFWQDRGRMSRGEVAGLVVFVAAFLVYLRWMTPPSFTSQETHLFLSAKGTMAHISPLNQSLIGWVNMLGRIALAWLAYRKFLFAGKAFSSFAGFMVAGALIATTFGLAAVETEFLQLAQLQPMRMFEWVNFFAFVLLVCATVVAWQDGKPLGILLLVVILLNILDSLWGIAWLYLGITCFILEWMRVRIKLLSVLDIMIFLRWGGIGLALAATAMWLLRDYHSFESFRDIVPVVVVLGCSVLFWFSGESSETRQMLVTGVLAISLLGHSINVHRYFGARQNSDFDAACLWIASNTSPDARFITAVMNGNNFRARAMRTSVNESQSALYWVDPIAAEGNGKTSQKVFSARSGEMWDMNVLNVIAEDWHADYILLEGGFPAETKPVHSCGEYHIFEIPRATH